MSDMERPLLRPVDFRMRYLVVKAGRSVSGESEYPAVSVLTAYQEP